MSQWLKFAGLWAGAATLALALSWVAVSQVRDRVSNPIAIVPTSIVAVEPTQQPPTTVVVESLGGTSEIASTTTLSSTTSTVSSRSNNQGAGSVTTPTQASRTTTSTTAPPPSTTTTMAPATTTTAGTAFKTTSHITAGGTVTIRSSPGIVNFVSAVPAAGYTVELRDSGPERVRVRFDAGEQNIDFEAEWDDGRLEISSEESDS